MIRRITGKVVGIGRDRVVIDVCGFGLEVLCPADVIENLRIGEEVTMLTTMTFGDEPRIYGFLSEEEQRVFERLMRVPKVGPKTALRILSSSDTETLVSMIKSGDHRALSRIPGIGLKTAERIVAELRKEFSDFEVEEIHDFSDALDALVALGYSTKEAISAIKSVAKPGMNVEDIIKGALRFLSKL